MDSEDLVKVGVIAIVAVVDWFGLTALGLEFHWASAAIPAITWVGLMALAWFYLTWRIDPAVSRLMRETAHLVAFTATAAVLSYIATASALPLIDDRLVRFDQLMGFDWLSYVAFVNERPWLGAASSLVYLSTLPQVAIAAIVLPMLGMAERAREFVLAVMLAALIAIAISAILPSAGALAHFRPDPAFLAGNAPVVDLAYKDEFFRMRALQIPVISLDTAKGLIAFPSYHIALSVLIVLAFRGRWPLFAPLAALNFGVILATPVDGGHHLSDALAGAAVAVISLVITSRLRRFLSKTSLESPSSPDEVAVALRPGYRVAGGHDPA